MDINPAFFWIFPIIFDIMTDRYIIYYGETAYLNRPS